MHFKFNPLIINTLALFFTLFTFSVFAQSNSPWQNIEESTISQSNRERQIIPQEYRVLSLDEVALTEVLNAAPLKHTRQAETEEVILTLPMPDGTNEQFRIVDAPIMAPALAAKYPAIHSYAGQGIDDATAYVRFGVTQFGFHAMILSAEHSTVFIDAYAKGDTEHYISYYKKDYKRRAEDDFKCHTEGETKQQAAQNGNGSRLFSAGGDCQLRTYRLALACTQEYATFHGGTVASVMSAYNVAMNRVNGVYENEFAITMELVSNTDELIFLSEPDPYTNNSGALMLGQNQTTCDNEIGSSNYDIGHVFSTGGGGIAGLGVPCRANQKARGVTGLGSPINDPFYIDYVAHEMGHQFGANHTFNNSCGGNRNGGTAMEPGSASTIMGYAGICAPNVQSNSDDYFHAISLQEVYSYVVSGAGSTCPVIENTPNNPPVATVENTNYTIPANTPFMLTVSATDPDNDALTYCWEQMDNEISIQPPVATSDGGPNFRSLAPTTSPTRFFPSIDNIVNGTTDEWEVLPSVTRTMDFRCVVRDNNMGEGCTDEVDVTISVNQGAGPFTVLAPNTNVTWTVGELREVTWNTAQTEQAPVACANVDVLLSIDGGNTYPIVLATNVPNDGSHQVSVPNNVTSTARVMVFCSDNIFFDISDTNFEIIEPLEPTFALSTSPQSLSLCNDVPATYTINVSALGGFSGDVNLSVTGLPNDATATFSPATVTNTGSATMTIDNLGDVDAGNYNITINANSATISQSTSVELELSVGQPMIQQIDYPVNGATGISLVAELNWGDIIGANDYQIVVATSPSFEASSVVFNSTVNTSNALVTGLEEGTVYYWHVNASTACGTGDFSEVNVFQTGQLDCETYEATDVPIEITVEENTIISTIILPAGIVLSDMEVDVEINHTWIGDLDAILVSPTGIEVLLFDQPGVPGSNYGCNEDDIEATFEDDADNTAEDFENTCEDTDPAISGTYQPVEPLSDFYGQPAGGMWTLIITDNVAQDGGELISWSIQGCATEVEAPQAPTYTTTDLILPQGTTATITNANMLATTSGDTPNELVYTVTSLPENGILILNGSPLVLGSTFTQADINANVLSYTHNGNDATTDYFNFSLQNDDEGLLVGSLNISIVQNSISVVTSVLNALSCNGGSDGSISVEVTGGTAPYTYSIDGVNFQSSNVFTGLSAGTYNIVVRDNFNFDSDVEAFTLTEPESITITTTVDGSTIDVDAEGGEGDFDYNINGGEYQDDGTFSDLANGTYEVCALDENDCVACTTVTIAVNNISATAEETAEIACNGDSNGIITVNATGGTAPYTYSINGGTPQGSNVFSFLSAGTYTITIQDNDGFTFTTNSVTIDNPDPITISAVVDGNTIDVDAEGGEGDFDYNINGGGYQDSDMFTGLANGTYEVCVVDENDCVACTVATIAVNNISATAETTAEIACAGENTGTIVVNAVGGTSPYTYSMNDGASQSSNMFSLLGAGTYIFTVQDSNGFTFTTNPITLSAPQALDISNDINGDIVTVNVAGGTAPYTYNINGGVPQGANIFTGLANGTYNVCVQDANGCTTCESALIAVNMMVVNAELVEGITCNSEDNAVIEVSAAGGVEPYSYSLNGADAQSSNVFTGLAAGTYTIEVTDANSMVLTTNTVAVSNPADLTLGIMISDNTITAAANGGTGALSYTIDGVAYQGSNVFENVANGTYELCVRDENNCTECEVVEVLINTMSASVNIEEAVSCYNEDDGIVVINTVGGTAPYTYSLNENDAQSSNEFIGLEAGQYVVVVTDANGFNTTVSFILDNPTELDLQASSTENTIVATATGGTGDLTYTIDNISYQTSGEFTNLPNGTYEVCVRDANGCTDCEEVTVAINTMVVVAELVQNVSCNGEDDGIIEVGAAGGTAPYTYSINGEEPQSSHLFTGLAIGVYEVTVMDANNFTVSTNAVTVTSPDDLEISTTVSGLTVTVNAMGGTPPYQYSSNGTNFTSSNELIFEESGTYTIYVMDSNGCLEDITQVISIAEITATINVEEILDCFGGSNACISVDVVGATPPIQVMLEGVVQTDNFLFCDLNAGLYEAVVTDANGATFTTAAVEISNPPLIDFDYSVACDVLTVSADGGTGDLSITLDGDEIVNEVILPNGPYELVVEDENGCSFTNQVVINDVVSATVEVEHETCADSEDGVITITNVVGGTPEFQYSLDNNPYQSGNVFDGLEGDSYEISVRDGAGCVYTTMVEVGEPDGIEAMGIVTGDMIIVTVTGAVGELMYSINGIDFQSSNTFEGLAPGEYTITVQDENGCEATVDAEVLTGVEDAALDLDFSISPNPNNGDFDLIVNMPTDNNLIVRVYDVAGKEIYRNVFVKNGISFSQRIQVNALAVGSYFVTVHDGQLTGTKEIVIIR